MNGSGPSLKKMYLKVITAAVTLIMVITMTVSVSYAWVILSKNPAVSGAQVTIAGGTTILLAPDITSTVEVNGQTVTVHYPGKFDDSISLSGDGYAYLQNLAGLAPVSTADGLNWIVPVYDEATGIIKNMSEFYVDNELILANPTEPAPGGSYFYIDFWVVSPGSEYKLRISSDVKSGEGSSVVEIPEAVEDDTALSGLSLTDPDGSTAASVRIGFLVSNDAVPDEDMLSYSRSRLFDTRYNKLLGSYQEPGDALDVVKRYKFTIYEPNGTFHTSPLAENGNYYITRPLSYDPFTEVISEKSVSNILTVQTGSAWRTFGEQRQIDQVFQAGINGRNDVTKDNATDKFFSDYLQWQVTSYITAGKFFTSTNTLYTNASASGVVTSDAIASNVGKSGATDDVYITELERNTPQRIRMFIWLEGQDIDCTSVSKSASEFLLNLELAGSNQ